MKLILRISLYLGVVILSTASGVVIAIGPLFWSILLIKIVLGVVALLCVLSICFSREDILFEWNRFAIRWIRRYKHFKEWKQKKILNLLLWLICRFMGKRNTPVPPPSPKRQAIDEGRETNSQDHKTAYYTGHIGVA